MTDPRPASERAADLRARILAVVEAGKFTLCTDVDKWAPFSARMGCAIVAAGFAMGANTAQPLRFSGLLEAVEPLASKVEAQFLEDGFENWRPNESPFYALGVDLRSLAEKAAP